MPTKSTGQPCDIMCHRGPTPGGGVRCHAPAPNAGTLGSIRRVVDAAVSVVLLEVGEGNLQKQSVVVVSQIASVPRGRLRERVGALSQARVEQILAGLRFQQSSFFRE